MRNPTAASPLAACSGRWKASPATWPRTHRPGGQPGDPDRQEPARLHLVGDRERADRQGDERDRLPALGREAALGGDPEQPPAAHARRPGRSAVEPPSARRSDLDRPCSSVSAPPATSPTVTRIVTNGSARPSLSPLSTLRALRMTAGTRGLATTAWPSAASVGASITPTSAACQGSTPPKITRAAAVPATIVSGSPIPSSRPDRLGSVVQRRTSRLDASAKRTITSAAFQQEDHQLVVHRQVDDAEHRSGQRTRRQRRRSGR